MTRFDAAERHILKGDPLKICCLDGIDGADAGSHRIIGILHFKNGRNVPVGIDHCRHAYVSDLHGFEADAFQRLAGLPFVGTGKIELEKPVNGIDFSVTDEDIAGKTRRTDLMSSEIGKESKCVVPVAAVGVSLII